MLRLFSAALILSTVVSAFAINSTAVAEESKSAVLELRVYTCEPGKLDALKSRFRDHTMEIFEKHGMKNIGYWIPTDGDAAKTTLIYLIQHESRTASKKNWKAFVSDPQWKKVAKASREAHGKILAKAPESTYLTLTDYSADSHTPAKGKVYELRTYKTNPGKLDALHSRFRDHTDKLFKRHGMTAIGYFSPEDEPESKDTLIYILEYDDRDAAKAGWKAFLSDPEWKAAYKASTADGRLLKESPGSVYMTPADFSPLRD